MNNEYLDKLPHDIRSLVEEIEEKSNIEIEIQIDATRISRSLDQKGSLACEVDQHSARILIALYCMSFCTSADSYWKAFHEL
jgi:hypothetical protein